MVANATRIATCLLALVGLALPASAKTKAR